MKTSKQYIDAVLFVGDIIIEKELDNGQVRKKLGTVVVELELALSFFADLI